MNNVTRAAQLYLVLAGAVIVFGLICYFSAGTSEQATVSPARIEQPPLKHTPVEVLNAAEKLCKDEIFIKDDEGKLPGSDWDFRGKCRRIFVAGARFGEGEKIDSIMETQQ